MLAGGGATPFAAAVDFALAVSEVIQKLKIFVIDEHRPGALAVDENRVLLLGPNLGLCALAHRTGIFAATKRSKRRHDGYHQKLEKWETQKDTRFGDKMPVAASQEMQTVAR